LSYRDARRAIDGTLYPGVPDHLRRPLQNWVREFLDPRLAERVAATLRLQLGTTRDMFAIEELAELEGATLLDVIDVGLHSASVENVGPNPEPWKPDWDPGAGGDKLQHLDNLLSLLRRGAHRSVTDLEADIRGWIQHWNNDPKPYVWTKTAEEILDSIGGHCQRLLKLTNDSGH
jgi:hypothetical protein